MDKSLEEIIEGMQGENQALIANGEQPKYSDEDFAAVTTEYNKNQETVIETPEIEEESPQVDTITEEDSIVPTEDDELYVAPMVPEIKIEEKIWNI